MLKKIIIFLLISNVTVANAMNPKTIQCMGCHGMDGNAMVPIFPSLASLSSKYLENQIHSFRKGNRDNSTMTGIALSIKEKDIKEISDFYSKQKSRKRNSPDKTKELYKLGKKLYNEGNPVTGQPACFVCHGNEKKPVLKSEGVPGLNMQTKGYVFTQLKKFKSKVRFNDGERAMRNIVDVMSERDLEAVAEYSTSIYPNGEK